MSFFIGVNEQPQYIASEQIVTSELDAVALAVWIV